jgi:hypothetical protein
MLKRFFINFIVKHLFCGLTDKDVLTFYSGDLYIGGQRIEKETVAIYSSEAFKMLNSKIMQEIDNKIIVEANKVMFNKSKTAYDMMFGKAMLHTIDLRRKYLEELSKFKN